MHLAQYVRSNNHPARRAQKRTEKKKEPDVIRNNMRATRIKLKRDCAADDSVMLAYDELYRIQLLNRVAHENKLPVVKCKKSKLLASIRRRIACERAKIEEEFRELIGANPHLA